MTVIELLYPISLALDEMTVQQREEAINELIAALKNYRPNPVNKQRGKMKAAAS